MPPASGAPRDRAAEEERSRWPRLVFVYTKTIEKGPEITPDDHTLRHCLGVKLQKRPRWSPILRNRQNWRVSGEMRQRQKPIGNSAGIFNTPALPYRHFPSFFEDGVHVFRHSPKGSSKASVSAKISTRGADTGRGSRRFQEPNKSSSSVSGRYFKGISSFPRRGPRDVNILTQLVELRLHHTGNGGSVRELYPTLLGVTRRYFDFHGSCLRWGKG